MIQSGIYKFISKTSGLSYIGQSVDIDIRSRKNFRI